MRSRLFQDISRHLSCVNCLFRDKIIYTSHRSTGINNECCSTHESSRTSVVFQHPWVIPSYNRYPLYMECVGGILAKIHRSDICNLRREYVCPDWLSTSKSSAFYFSLRHNTQLTYISVSVLSRIITLLNYYYY